MAVDSKHVNANLRFLDTQRETVQTLTRIRPDIQGHHVEFISDAIQHIRNQPLGNAVLTIVSELVEA